MTREEAVTVLKAFMKNPLFSDEHKAAFNIAIHDIKAHHDWDINNLILINKDNYEPLEQEPTTKNDLGVDCISKQAVLNKILKFSVTDGRSVSVTSLWTEVNELPLVPPQEPQSFKWCDTCKEYDQEKHCCHRYSKVIRDTVAEIEQEPRWIPVSEKLPNDRDWYLGIFKEPDTGWINPLPFVCDYVGSETKATTKEYWILRGFTDRDEKIDYYFNLECVAWMPLPQPYKEVEE